MLLLLLLKAVGFYAFCVAYRQRMNDECDYVNAEIESKSKSKSKSNEIQMNWYEKDYDEWEKRWNENYSKIINQ